MAAYGGEVRAVLRLDLGQFNKDIATATSRMKSLSSAGAGAASKSMSESFKRMSTDVTRFNQRLGEVKAHSSALGNAVVGEAKKMSAALSSIMPGDAFAKQFNLGTRALLNNEAAARKINTEYSRMNSYVSNLGKINKNAFPTEYIEKSSNAQQRFNKQIQEAAASYAGTGRSFLAANNSIGSSGQSAFNRISNSIKGAGNTLANLTNSVVSFNVWMGALVGKVFYDFTVGAAMARDESLSLFKFVGMSANEVNRLSVATDQYAQASSKVAQPEMLSAWKLVRISHKLTADQMIKNQDILGDTIGLFKSNGRTAEDAGRAIEDAMAGGADGIKRMKEIGITSMKELTDKGFDPKKPETFFNALRKIYDERGILGYGMKVTSLADRFENLKEKIQLIGIAAGETLMPAMEMIVNVFTAVFNAISKPVAGAMVAITGLTIILGFFWDTLVTIGSGITSVITKIGLMTGAIIAEEGATTAATASSLGFSGALKAVGKASLSFLVTPIGLAITAIAALAAILIYAGNKYGWFRTSVENANNALSQGKAELDAVKQKQTDAQASVDRWTAAVNNAKPGTEAYATATKKLEDAKTTLAGATDEATEAETYYNQQSGAHQQVMNDYADALNRATKAVVAYRVAIGELTPEEGKSITTKAEWASTLSDEDRGIVKTTKNLDNLKAKYDDAAKSTDKLPKASQGVSGALAQLDLDFTKSKGPIEAFTTAVFGSQEVNNELYESLWDLASFKIDIGAGINFEPMAGPAHLLYKVLHRIYCIIVGCSPGIIPALRQLWGMFNTVFGGVKDVVNSAVGILTSFANTLKTRWKGTIAWLKKAWKDAVKTIQSNPVVAKITQSGAWVINWLKKQWVNARNFIQSLPIVGRFMSSGNIPGAKTAVSAMTVGGGPGGPGFLNMASGFRYIGYGGMQQSLGQTFASGAGNCVDGTLAQMALADMYGIPAEMIQTTWRGSPHVYARIAGRDRDIANRALTGSWNAPPRGPGGRSGAVIIYGDVYGYNDFVRKVEQANNRLVRR